MKLTTRLVHGAVFCAALIGLTSFGATPTAVWKGSDLAEGVVKGGMTLHLNENTVTEGVVTIDNDLPIHIDTGLSSSSAHAGTEATVVVTLENVGSTFYGGLITCSISEQEDAVGMEYWNGYVCGVFEGAFSMLWGNSWYGFASYPTDFASHKIAFAYAGPSSGTGSGGYNGCAYARDGGNFSSCSSIVYVGPVIARINVGGYQKKNILSDAKITRIAVYNSALSEADLKKATGEDEPEPEEGDVWGNVGNATAGGIATKADNGNYSCTWTINFTNTTNVCTTEIGSDGEVAIKQIKMAKRLSDNKDTKTPSKLTLAQGDVSIESTALEFVENGISAYTSTGAVVANGTRTAYVFTFDGTTKFDTTKDITLSFNTNNVGLGVMQPANPLFQVGDHSPMIEITGDYTGHGEGPIIIKDEENHTWMVDTTYGAYTFTNDDINDLKTNKWAVTLKSRSELGATINFGSISGSQPSHFVIESGVHAMSWMNGNKNINFNKTGTAEDPSVLVKSGATLNFTARDITGWEGAAVDKYWNVIRVNDGGVLNLIQGGSYTHYYQGRYWLDPGATLNADSYSSNTFRLNGGAVKGYEQLYVPNTTNGAPAATISVANGLYVASNTTPGLGIFVGTNATLEVDALVSSDGAQPLTKWGAGTLALNGSLSGYSGLLTIYEGTLKLPQGAAMAGSFAMAANTVLDIAYDGEPSEGTVLFTATGGIDISEYAVVKVNGEGRVYTVANNAIVFGHVEVTVPEKNFTYEPKVNASPSGWITSFGGETFTAAGQFRVGPDGECVSAVSSGQYPWYNLGARSNYTMALYADISQIAYDMTGRYLVELGGKGNGINQGILMTKDGNVQLFQANKTTVQHTLTTTNAPAAGYHLFVWTQSTANGGALYVDGVRVGTIPEMTSATSTGFQLGSMHGGAWDSANYAQGIGMAVAGVYGWGQVLSPAQVALLAKDYPAVTGGIEAKSVPQSISGTLNLVHGNTITSGVYACSIAVAYGAIIDIKYDGVVKEGAEILTATSISIEGATFTINGEPLPEGLEMDASNGRLVITKQKVTKLLNPLAVKEGEALKVSCNAEATAGEAAKAYDGNASTYFAPGDAANNLGVSWTGIEFTNGVIVTRIAYASATPKRMIGGVFQGANTADFSDAVNLYVVDAKPSGMVDVTLDEAKGPYRYLRFMGMYGGNVSEIRFYGLADSGTLAPTKVPTVEGWSDNGVANVRVTADGTVPQVFVVQRAMRNFCDPDGSDYETCVTLAPQLGEAMTWTDLKPTGYAMYRAKGFNANGESDWKYFELEPEKLINGAEKPTFGGNGPGFYADEAEVTIDYPVANAKIYYTLDGSTPTTNSLFYTGPIALQDVCAQDNPLSQIMTNPQELTNNIAYGWRKPAGDQPNVNVIRARAFLPDGSASTNEIAGTWMIGPTVGEALTNGLRVVSVITDRENYFGDPKGIMVPGDIYNEKGWVPGQVGQPNANYFQRGADWERPAFIEMFDEKGVEMFSNKMGTRVHGNWSRAAAKKTLVCYSRKELGSKNIKLGKKFRMFNDEPDHNKYKRIMLRNGGNDWYKACLRDAVGQSMFRGYVNTDTQGYEPTVLYVNGEYWGVYNLRHCYSKQHFEDWNGAVEDNIDYVKLDPDSGDHFEVQEGDFTAMWNIMRYMVTCTADGVMSDEEYARVEAEVDMDDMIDFHIVNIFLCNSDWIKNGNNMGYWRNRSGSPDQKWHFTVYDCDSAMGFDSGSSASSDKLSDALNVNDTNDSAGKMAPGFLKRCFMNAGFKQRFANRFADLLNTALRVERTTNIVAQAAARIEPEIGRTAARWTNMESYSKWTERLATFNAFFVNRPGYQWGHIKSCCGGGDYANVTLANSVGNGAVKINTIESGKEFELPFTGRYFTNIPVTLTAMPESGYEFAGWKIGEEVVSTDETIELMPTDGVTVQAVFEEAGENPQQALRIVEIYGSTNTQIDPDGNTGEFVIVTNTSDQVVGLTGLKLVSEKVKKGEYTTTLTVVMTAGEVPAYGSYKLEQKTLWPDDLTRYISNGEIQMTITDADGAPIQVANTKFVDEADGSGASMLADNLENPCKAWHVGPIHDVPPKPAEELLLTGNYPDGTNITLKGDTTVIVSNATFGAKLAFSSNCVATVTLPEDTASTIPQITAEGKLVFGGEGKLTIAGKKELISTTGDWVVDGGDITITATPSKDKDAAVLMKGNYLQSGGKVTLNLCGENRAYGLQWKDQKGFTATIAGGEFVANITSGASSAAFKSNKGSNDFIVSGGKLTATLASTDASVADVAGNVKINGTAVVDVTGNETATHARVFKTEKKVTIGDTATVDVKAPGVESEAFSADNQITIEGGIVRVEACDDCFSAQTNIVVSGGIVYGHSISNDVFDSNGEMTISGGTVIAYTLAEGHEAFDTEPAAADEQSHTFTISGGTIVGLGGKNAAWPSDCDFQQETATMTKLDPATYSEKYLVVDGVVETLYAKLPKIDDAFILLATTKELAGDPTVSDTCPVEEPIAEGVPAWRKLKHNQQNLRFAEIYGNTAEDPSGDVGEYFVLTNLSANVVYLKDLEIEITKEGTSTKKSKCHFTVTGDRVVEPYGTYTFEQADWTAAGWEKITNGDLTLKLTDADGKEVQKGETSNDFYPECDGNGASIVAKTFGKKLAMTMDDWEPSFRWYYFTTDGETSTITGFGTTKLLETTLTIPRELGKVPVMLVDTNAFADCALTTLKVTLTNETLKVMATEGKTIAQYDMSESEGELVLGYALNAALNVSGSVVVGPSTATLAFDLGDGITQEVQGTTDNAAKQYGITVKSGILNFGTTSGGATSFRDRVVTADGENAVVNLGIRDATGHGNPAVKIVVKNGGTMQVAKRDTLVAPVELDNGTVKLMAGCADNSRGLDLYNANGNNWTVSGDSTFAVDPAIGTGDGRKLVIRRGDWNIDVAADSLFTVEPTIVAKSGATTVGKLVKSGAGTLYLAATNNTYETETVVNGGTLKLAQGELNGALTMAADTALDLHYDGTPTHGTVVLTAAALNLADSVAITVDGVSYVIAKSETTLTIMDPVAQVGDKSFGTIVAAAKAAGDGGVMKLLKPYAELEDEIEAAAITLTPGEGENVYTNNYIWSEGIVLRVSEIMPKPSDKPYEITTQSGYDKNGLESGWVELLNTTNAWVDLKDYKFMRANRGKKANQADYGNFPSVMIGPNEYFSFYTSERYSNSASEPDSAFEHGTFDGKPIWYDDMLIWGDKVNPKKFPMVTFAYLPAGAKKETVVDTVVIPSDIPEGYSIIVGERDCASYTKRWLCDTPTFNAPNDEALQPLGPNVGPLYGKKHSVSEFNPMPPAQFGEDYEITLNANPVYNGTDSDEITNVVLVYRTKLDDDTLDEVTMTFVTNDTAGAGMTYTATIPHEAFDAIGNGQVIQWKTRLYDAAGNVWTSPSFNNPDDGYEWYGTITEPGDLNSANLPTWHMFLDADSLEQMDIDADKQTLPNKARAAIYDASTSNYYDYVRIDLRGNTSKKFTKKSHGFRFAKAHPLTMRDIVSGEDIEEIRKTSLIGEPADPSYMRQLTAFWLLNRVGSPAPFDFPVRCNRNGEFYQMAFNSERFTDELIEDVYGLDKYGYSYKNVGTLKSGGGTTAGGIEKKTPDDGHEDDISVLQNELRAEIKAAQQVGGTTEAQLIGTDTTGLDNAALTKFVVQKFNLPAWLNYLAVTRITQEMDDVWANISIYYDNPEMKEGVRGTGTWMPLAYDMNVSFGQYYVEGGVGRTGPSGNRDHFKGHPFYGGNRVRCYSNDACTSTLNSGNDGFESVWQNAKFRRLYLRRLRTLMDQELKAPGTPETEIPLMVQMRELEAIMHDDAAIDRKKYPDDGSFSAIDVWGSKNFPTNMTAGIDDLWTNYIQPRQTHLFVTHSVTNVSDTWQVGYGVKCNAGIPGPQSPIEELKGGFSAEFDEANGVVIIRNANDEAVDLSNWSLAGPLLMTLPPGTVVDSNDCVHVAADRRAYVAAIDADITDQVIVGNGSLGKDPTAAIVLKDADGTPVIDPESKSEQEKYLRLWGFCGAPLTGGEDGPGEFIVLTNLNPMATLDLEGAYLNICKFADAWEKAKCQITFPADSQIEAGGYLRIEKKDGLEVWTAIQNGDLKIKFLAANGASIYTMDSAALSQSGKGVKDQDKFLKAIAYNQTPDDWEAHDNSEAPVKPEPPVPPPGPGGEVITGEFPEGTNIVLTADKTLIVSNANFGAALTLSGAYATTLYLPSDTTSRIPVLSAAGAITVDGMGTLSMSNNVTMITAGDLIVTNGTLNLDFRDGAAKASAVYLKGNFTQLGGDIALNLVSDNTVYGIQVDKKDKEAFFEGGNFTATVEGGEKSAAIKLEKGSSHANLKGGTTTVTMSGPTNRFINTEGKIKIKGDYTATIKSSGLDARVFKATKEVAIEGCVVTGEATGAGSEIFSSDDSIKVSGGVIGVTAAEDCFSAQTNVVISAGKIQLLSTGGDAIDSNGDVTIKGGYVLANTTAEGENGIEADGKLVISGGTVVAVGYKDIIHVPDAGSVGCYTSNSVKYDKNNKYIEVAGTNAVNKLICTVNLKDKCAKSFSLIATCPGFLGTVSYTNTKPDKDLPYIEKLDESLDGAFLTLLDRVEPGKATEMEAKTEEEAQKEIKKYEVVLTDEDIQAGVEPNMLKMVPQPVTNEVGAVTYYAVVAVNPEVVPAPTVGEDETGEVKPIVVTPTAGGTEVSVGIVNATKGLWYGYEVCDTLSEGFANDVPSFARATDEAITIKGTKRTGSSSFFRVKVLPAQPH